MAEVEQHGTALVVGASRGLGLGLVREYLRRGWAVIATARGASALDALEREAGGRLRIEALDITDPDGIGALSERLSETALDLLFVNAGVANDPHEPIGAATDAEFARVMATNVLGPMRVIERLADRVVAGGVIVAMSSGLGSVSGNETGRWEVYRASKAGLNTCLRSFANRSGNQTRTVLAMDPGWVRTDMGGPNATLDVETSVRGMADTIAARRGQPGAAYVSHRNAAVAW